jgi:colanic acid/amylovoran biosynthesis glycosyltransferase
MKPVAYILAAFPTLTETFIVGEIAELRRHGLSLPLFALARSTEEVPQPDARRLADEVTYAAPLLSAGVLRANLVWALRRPARYLGTLGLLITAAWRNPVHLAKSLYVYLKAVDFADRMVRLGVGHVHAHWATYPTTAALAISKLTGLSFSFTAHAWDVDLFRTLLPEKVRLARFIVTCTGESQARLQALLPPESRPKVILNYHGVMADELASLPREASGDRPVIVGCGALFRRKGFADLVRACGILKRGGQRFYCAIIGDGPQRAELAALIAAEGLSEEVTLVGPLPQAEVFRQYARSDIVALPCQPAVLRVFDREAGLLKGLEAWFEGAGRVVKDGIPNVLVEAMVMGLPVVSTVLSGIPELVRSERNGVLVPPGDVTRLAGAIGELLGDPALRKRLGEQAAIDARARFDRPTNAGILAQIFLTQLDTAGRNGDTAAPGVQSGAAGIRTTRTDNHMILDRARLDQALTAGTRESGESRP